MGIYYITLIKNNLTAENLSILFFGMAVLLTLFYFVRKAARTHINKIISVKKAKELLINQLIDSLAKIQDINLKLINQKAILESYENDTIKEAIDNVKAIRSKYGIFNYLNNQDLVKEIIFYFDGKLKLLDEMLEFEENSYQFQSEYHIKLVQFNRDLENYKSMSNSTEEIVEYKRNILNELDKIRNRVSASLINLKEKREEYLNELKNSQDMAAKLSTKIKSFKHRELDSKRFYPRYLAFA